MGDIIPFPNKKADRVGRGLVKPESETETDSAISDLMMLWAELGILDVSDFDGAGWKVTDLTGIMSVPVTEETVATTVEDETTGNSKCSYLTLVKK